MDHSFGAGTLDRHDVCWPGDADATRRWIAELHDRWRATPQNASSDMLGSTEHTRWPFRDRPFTDLAAWANMELTKNSAATPALLRLPVPWSC